MRWRYLQMTKLTNSGFDRTRLIERLAQLKAKAKSIFGQDIDLSSSTQDGQHIGIFAEAVADLDELAEATWLSFDPDLATGTSLSRLVKINGITRNQGAKSVVTLMLTGKPNTLIPKGSIVSNEDNTVKVYTLEDVRLNSDGNAEVDASPDEAGAVRAQAGSLTYIRSPIYGWKSVTNERPMTVGKVRETDQELRLRRRASVSRGNRNMAEALWAALSDLNDVIEVSVLENSSNKVNDKGLPPHSIHAVILGGDDTAIAKTIWAKKSGGVQLEGTETVVINDANGNAQEVKFTRPVSVPIKLKVYITPRAGWSYKTPTQIRDTMYQFINSNQRVGEQLITSLLYTPLNEIGGFSINRISVAKKGESYSERPLELEFYERLDIDIADIEVVTS